jgi:hypothetical protein
MSLFLPSYQKGFIDVPGGGQVPYVIIGNGPVSRAVIPGAGDGLSMVTDAAIMVMGTIRRTWLIAQHWTLLWTGS